MGNKKEIKIDAESLDDFICKGCTCKVFITAYRLKRVSALQSPTGRPSVIPIPAFVCLKCGTELIPN